MRIRIVQHPAKEHELSMTEIMPPRQRVPRQTRRAHKWWTRNLPTERGTDPRTGEAGLDSPRKRNRTLPSAAPLLPDQIQM
jgi:hypothetical protein